MNEVGEKSKMKATEFMQRATEASAHPRTARMIAQLAAGFHLFSTFAEEIGALDREELRALGDKVWNALLEQARAQSNYQRAGDAALRFIELLRAAISSGAAHIANVDGQEPQNHLALGWQEGSSGLAPKPGGICVGWIAGDDLYLEPDASYKAAQAMASDGNGLTVGSYTLRRRLKEAGLLSSTAEGRHLLTIRKQIAGHRQEVLHLKVSVLGIEEDTISSKPRKFQRQVGR